MLSMNSSVLGDMRPTSEDVMKMSAEELREFLQARGMKTKTCKKMKKADLQTRAMTWIEKDLMEDDVESDEDENTRYKLFDSECGGSTTPSSEVRPTTIEPQKTKGSQQASATSENSILMLMFEMMRADKEKEKKDREQEKKDREQEKKDRVREIKDRELKEERMNKERELKEERMIKENQLFLTQILNQRTVQQEGVSTDNLGSTRSSNVRGREDDPINQIKRFSDVMKNILVAFPTKDQEILLWLEMAERSMDLYEEIGRASCRERV